MAQFLANNLKSVSDSVANKMAPNAKIADLEKDMKHQHSKQNTTTDFGSKIADLDHWLKVADEKNNYVGPSLLEDHIARERVGCYRK